MRPGARRSGLIAILILAGLILVGSASAATLSSFVEGPSVSYDFTDASSRVASIALPMNACAETFALIATPGEKTDTALVPIDAVLITDVSGSMSRSISSTDSTQKITIARSVDSTFIDRFIVPGSDVHRLSLVSYSTTSSLDSPLTSDASALVNTVSGYRPLSSTCISCAIDQATRELSASARPDALKIIILMTDGLANRDLEGRSYRETDPNNGAKQEAYAYACSNPDSAVNQSIVVNTVAFGADADTSLLSNIADCSPDGSAYVGTNAAQLYSIYENLAHVTGTSWPTPNMTIETTRVLTSDAPAHGDIAIDGNCPGCGDPLTAIENALYECYADGTACSIPVTTSTSTPGLVNLHDLAIDYSTGGIVATDTGLMCGTLPRCGDGIQQPGEQCDSTPGCTATCTLPTGGSGVCGDGTQQPGEQCDFGADNKPASYDCGLGPGERCSFCTNSCELITQFDPGDAQTYECGNGLPEPGEQCDYGEANANTCDPGTTGCTVCTRGTVESGGCRLRFVPPDTGTSPLCGDATIDPGEQCDRGTENLPPGSSCDPAGGSCTICLTSCQLQTFTDTTGPGTGVCGDDVVQSPNADGISEQCDAGTQNRPAGYDCGLDRGEACSWCEQGTCTLHVDRRDPPQCGDGILDPSLGEQCDDGANNGAACSAAYGATCSYCTASCQVQEVAGGTCGDGTPQAPEQCDHGSANGRPGDTCAADCTLVDTTPPDITIPPTTSGCLDIPVTTGTYLSPVVLRSYVSDDTTPPSGLRWSLADAGGLAAPKPTVVGVALEDGVLSLTKIFDPAQTGDYEPRIEVSDESGNTAELCVNITVTPPITEAPPEPNTRLLVTKGTTISGAWEEDASGLIRTWGPYRLDVRVWQR